MNQRKKLFANSSPYPLMILAACCCAILAGCSASSGRGMDSLEGQNGEDAQALLDQDLAQGRDRFGDGTIPTASEGKFFRDILFDYDSSTVSEEYHEMLRKNAQILNSDETLKAEVEGHCDKRGTNEYNLALGEERAKSVAALMISFGARQSQLSTISYGEEIPVDPNDDEQAFARNRRAHFALYRSNPAQ